MSESWKMRHVHSILYVQLDQIFLVFVSLMFSMTWTSVCGSFLLYACQCTAPTSLSTWVLSQLCHNAPHLCYLSSPVPTEWVSLYTEQIRPRWPEYIRVAQMSQMHGRQAGYIFLCFLYGCLSVFIAAGSPNWVIHFSLPTLHTPKQTLLLLSLLLWSPVTHIKGWQDGRWHYF